MYIYLHYNYLPKANNSLHTMLTAWNIGGGGDNYVACISYYCYNKNIGNTPAQLSGHSAAHHEVPPVSQSHLFLMAHKIICPQEYAPPSTGEFIHCRQAQ